MFEKQNKSKIKALFKGSSFMKYGIHSYVKLWDFGADILWGTDVIGSDRMTGGLSMMDS